MIVTTKDLFKVAYGKFAVGAYNINNMEQCIGLFQGMPRLAGPVHHPDLQGSTRLCPRQDAGRPDPLRRRDLPRGHLCRPPGSRRRGDLLRLHRLRLLQLGDDRCLARAVRREHRDHPPGGRACARQGHLASKPSWACWAASKSTSRWTKRTPCSPIPTRRRSLSPLDGCDSLAVAIGTSHGAYKFKGTQGLHFERAGGDPAAAARLPAGHARLILRAAG